MVKKFPRYESLRSDGGDGINDAHWQGPRWARVGIDPDVAKAVVTLIQGDLQGIGRARLARFSHTGSDFRAAAAGRITEGLKERGL